MKTHPLVEFSGAVAVRLDSIESIIETDTNTCQITTTTGNVYIAAMDWDGAMMRLYECISQNEQNRA